MAANNQGAVIPIGQTPQGNTYIAAQALQPNTCQWDSYLLVGTAAGLSIPNPINLFTIPQGQTGSGFTYNKTWAETSMRVAGQLERPKEGTVNRILVEAIPTGDKGDDTNRVIAAMLEDMRLEFRVDQVLEYEGHLMELGGSGVTGMLDMANINPQSVVQAAPFVRSVPLLNPEIGIPSRTPFYVRLYRNTNSATLSATLGVEQDILIRVYLQGLFTRAIDG